MPFLNTEAFLGPMKLSKNQTVLPHVVNDKALWYSLSWKHLLPICNEYAKFAAHDPNEQMEILSPDKNGDNIWIFIWKWVALFKKKKEKHF